MNSDSGFPITQAKGVSQNGNAWNPSTPAKPNSHRSDDSQLQIPIGDENWEDLLGIYTGFLQGDECDNDTLPNPCPKVEDFSSMFVQNGSNCPIGDQNLTSYNRQNLTSEGYSDSLSSGEVTAPHQKVNSLADLMGDNREAYASSIVGAKLLQMHSSADVDNRNLQKMTSGDVDNRNLQKTTSGTHSNMNYNLNLPPRPEAGESSRSMGPFPFVPATPVQSKTYQISQVSNSSAQEKQVHNNIREDGEILLSTPNESIAAAENGRIDLNQTPQQKPPRRKKHRPKVIREGKPKQTPKPATNAKAQTPDDKPKVKRKYVRKNTSETANGGPMPAKKSKVRNRKLDFDLENGAKGESQDKGLDYQAKNGEGGYKVPFNLNLDAQISDGQSNSNIVPQDLLALVNMAPPRSQQLMPTRNENNYVHSNSNIAPQDSLALVNMAPPRNHPLNAISRIVSLQNSSANQSTQVQKIIHSSSRLPNSYGAIRQSTIQNKPPQLVGATEIQGSEMRYPRAISLMGSQLWSNEVSDTRRYNRDIGGLWRNGLDMGGKANVDYKFRGATSSFTPSGVKTHDEFSRQNGRSKDLQSGEWANTDIRGHSIHRNPNDKSNNLTHDWCMKYPGLRPEFHNQHASAQVHLCSEQVAPAKTSRSFSAVTNWSLGSASQRDSKSIPINGIINPTHHDDVKRRIDGQALSKGPVIDKHLELQVKSRRNYRNSTMKVAGLKEEGMISVDYIINLLKNLHIWNDNGQSALVPFNRDATVAPYKGGASVVEYKGGVSVVGYKGDGAVVPYKEFNPVKKQRPRPRVDLDPETDRLWNLLMGKEGSGSAETMDADKQKWWEEERKVFRGRVDSFIARMHLIQGDRRFSKWKGSVVDSVIGVFLTQNVSDHLSSSAFMSLAARFPLKLSTTCQPSNKSPSVKHHEVRITYPDGTTYEQKIPSEPASNQSTLTSIGSLEYKTNNVMTEMEPANNHSTVTSTESLEYKSNDVMTEKGTVLGNDHTNKTEEDIISSHSSSEDIRSSSGSNSEGDDMWNLNKNLCYLSEQTEGIVGTSQSYRGLLFGLKQSENQGVAAPASSIVYSDSSVLPSTNCCLEKWEKDCLGLSANECISTLASTEVEVTKGTGIIATNEYIGQNSESTFSGIENRIPKFQPSQVNHEILNKHPELKTDSRDKFVNRIGQENFPQESVLITGPTRSAEAFSKQPSGATHGPAKAGQVNSSEKQASNIGTTSPNPRKRKAEKEKVEQFDWDILRKQAQLKGGTREKCREHMDSLDYETLRNADVREISDAIKERGMNNMLAERMKSFLNRLVQDHEEIDLEWLRDVDPDKVKDYLLSIRGLGLKSVECVRLLTLHHLAFPVDTNVGRIAVRLGWVPLQPLPESLQLHLLELYPVLETIQKYIWPRLCNLDQETLYELHYQMITFGKVFCTKRDPNCNGCPMRGECRHFASAFASARLALPGPEEKRIVTSAAAAAPVTPNKGPGVIIKPMLLNSSEGNIDRGIMGSTGNCEPLIEEPLSPEPFIEVSERDIEDAFYEDPDEIPVIKLNTQEFATTLQSFMQEQMELGEADMSKALVALSPEFASMSIPKLKHVSRLRTEHQVYELPDSHPLLKEMDSREPDDPSPYLLAIWTPGETANSFQPPESTCSAQEGGGGLCNNKTCFSCNSSREAQAQTVRGTILVPCRTATRGSFPLNGTYFQVNEVFADHESSLKPIDVPRRLLWNLRKRTVFFGSSVTSIFKGLTTEGIQYCFWKGFVCVRGFDQKSRAPKPLMARLHISASKVGKQNE